MPDYCSSQQIQINLFMCTDHNNNRLQVIKGYCYSYFKENLWKSSNYDLQVIRKNTSLVLENKILLK